MNLFPFRGDLKQRVSCPARDLPRLLKMKHCVAEKVSERRGMARMPEAAPLPSMKMIPGAPSLCVLGIAIEDVFWTLTLIQKKKNRKTEYQST